MDNLDKSVDLLRDTVLVLDSTLEMLSNGTKNSKNVQKLLQTSRVFDLIAAAELINGTQAFKNSINPQIEEIVRQLGLKVGKLQKQRVMKYNKFKLNEGRLQGNKPEVSSTKNSQLSQLRVKKLRLQQSLSNARKQGIPSLKNPLE